MGLTSLFFCLQAWGGEGVGREELRGREAAV